MRKDNSSIPCPDSVRTDRGSNRWLRGSGWGERPVANTGSNGIGLGVLIVPFESLISASESFLVNANLSVGQKATESRHRPLILGQPEPLFSELLAPRRWTFVPLPTARSEHLNGPVKPEVLIVAGLQELSGSYGWMRLWM